MPQKTGQESKSRDARAKTILIVEDDLDIGFFVAEAIQEETNYQVLITLDSLEALSILDHIKPDLLLLDYQLPHMNGLELYDRLHIVPALSNVPAILMTASDCMPYHEIKQRHMMSLAKPFELARLLELIKQQLSSSSASCL